tara:strand:- start:344 stop:1069 length:726 start_codon:yes stop_codon:yes gene_type:complete
MKDKILIFIITYKASYRVKNVVQKIPFRYFRNKNFKIYISDDDSRDETINYIKQIKKKYKSKVVVNFIKKNVGYGANIKKCLNYAYKNKFSHAVMIHGDNQYNPKYIIKMLDNLLKDNKTAASVGSRMTKKINALKGKMPIYKFIGNIFLTGLFNFLHKTKFTDCHTGYWAYNLKIIKENTFKNLDDNFCFDIDLRLQLVSEGKFIKEIPIETFYGTERSSVHIIYALRFFLKTIIFKLFK